MPNVLVWTKNTRPIQYLLLLILALLLLRLHFHHPTHTRIINLLVPPLPAIHIRLHQEDYHNQPILLYQFPEHHILGTQDLIHAAIHRIKRHPLRRDFMNRELGML